MARQLEPLREELGQVLDNDRSTILKQVEDKLIGHADGRVAILERHVRPFTDIRLQCLAQQCNVLSRNRIRWGASEKDRIVN
jgi:hypothetical protein